MSKAASIIVNPIENDSATVGSHLQKGDYCSSSASSSGAKKVDSFKFKDL